MDNTIDQNPNSPEKLLAPWMLQNMRHQYEIGNRSLNLLGKRFLAGILGLAEDHSKFSEMYQWLASDEAKDFFLNNEPEGPPVLAAFSEIQAKVQAWVTSNKADITNEALKAILEAYIMKNFYTFRYELKLN